MVYYFLCFWALQKVNIPFEPFFHKKGKESFGSFPRIATIKKTAARFSQKARQVMKMRIIKSLIPGKLPRFPVAEELLPK